MTIALLADLSEHAHPDSSTESGILAYELADAFHDSMAAIGGLRVDLVARQGSWRGLPLISINLDDLEANSSEAEILRQEAIYMQVVLSGMLRGYDLVHSIAPVVTPLQLLAAMDIPIVQSLVAPADHPSTIWLPALVKDILLERTALTQPAATAFNARWIPPPVDLDRFRPAEGSSAYVLWPESDDDDRQTAEAIAAGLGYPLREDCSGDQVELMAGAALLLVLSNRSDSLPLCRITRALACGLPVAGWRGGGLESVLDRPGMGAIADRGDAVGLAERIAELSLVPDAVARRRESVVARNNPRSVIAAYRDLFRSVLESRSTARTSP